MVFNGALLRFMVLIRDLRLFWQELRDSKHWSHDAWLLCEDFNFIWFRSERLGSTFNVHLSRRFNALISELELIDIPLQNRKFSWSNLRSSPTMALLDIFFCTSEWATFFSCCLSTF